LKTTKRMTQGRAEGERRSRSESGPEASSDPLVHAAPVSRKEFSAGFDRCFGRVYAYVSRRVNDRKSCERIVSEILAANLDLLVDRGDERQELSQLKASSDRLIGLESARRLSTGTPGTAELTHPPRRRSRRGQETGWRRPPDRDGPKSVRPVDRAHPRSNHGRSALGGRRSHGEGPVARQGGTRRRALVSPTPYGARTFALRRLLRCSASG